MGVWQEFSNGEDDCTVDDERDCGKKSFIVERREE